MRWSSFCCCWEWQSGAGKISCLEKSFAVSWVSWTLVWWGSGNCEWGGGWGWGGLSCMAILLLLSTMNSGEVELILRGGGGVVCCMAITCAVIWAWWTPFVRKQPSTPLLVHLRNCCCKHLKTSFSDDGRRAHAGGPDLGGGHVVGGIFPRCPPFPLRGAGWQPPGHGGAQHHCGSGPCPTPKSATQPHSRHHLRGSRHATGGQECYSPRTCADFCLRVPRLPHCE